MSGRETAAGRASADKPEDREDDKQVDEEDRTVSTTPDYFAGEQTTDEAAQTMSDNTTTEILDQSGAPDPTPPVSTVRGPRVRVGAIVWGVLVAFLAATTLIVASSPEGRSGFRTWVDGLNPASITLLGILSLGVIILLITLASALRRMQR